MSINSRLKAPVSTPFRFDSTQILLADTIWFKTTRIRCISRWRLIDNVGEVSKGLLSAFCDDSPKNYERSVLTQRDIVSGPSVSCVSFPYIQWFFNTVGRQLPKLIGGSTAELQHTENGSRIEWRPAMNNYLSLRILVNNTHI